MTFKQLILLLFSLGTVSCVILTMPQFFDNDTTEWMFFQMGLLICSFLTGMYCCIVDYESKKEKS